jgi:alkyldihydroxyacetonephosphate synthase
MSIARETLRWNGWGRLDESPSLTPARASFICDELARRFGLPPVPPPPAAELASLHLPPSKLGAEALAQLRSACGEQGVSVGVFERVTHALGKSLPDLLQLRRGEISSLPDVVVMPRSEQAVAAVLRTAAEHHLAVVPFGGGTSVVGSVEAAAAQGQAGVVTLSSGQQSNGYGPIEDRLAAVRVVTPRGVLRTLEFPRSAAGPDLAALVLGSEGAFGVIVEATLRIAESPACQDFRGMLFGSFEAGVTTVREALQRGVAMSMLRLSDAAETELFQLLRHDPERRFDPSELALSAAARLGWDRGRAALIYGAEEPSAAAARSTMAELRRIGRAHGGLPLGRSPGRSWLRDRFRTPYLRDWLLDRGIAVDTLETALSWSRLAEGHTAIVRTLEGALGRHAGGGLAMAHLSHSYRDGGCLYFTILYPVDADRGVEQWRAIKAEASEAVLAAGGTISHHHGIGRDHAPWIDREKGELGLETLRAVKRSLDPEGILNPGVWL